MEWIEVPEKGLTLREVRTMTNRNVNLSDDLEKSVSAILAQVKEGGDEAIRALTKKFDGVDLTDFQVSESEIEEAVKAVGPEFLAVLKEAKENIEAFHREQVRKSWSKTFRDGVELGERFLPIQRAISAQWMCRILPLAWGRICPQVILIQSIKNIVRPKE